MSFINLKWFVVLSFSPLMALGQSVEGLRLQESGTPKAQVEYDLLNDVLSIISSEIGSQMSFSTNNVERMRIDDQGNVGIGTTSPGEALSVDGVVQSLSGGFRFPDGTLQTSAAVSSTLQLAPQTADPEACNASTDGQLALTSNYTTCVCRDSVGWVSTVNGLSSCVWVNYFSGAGTTADPFRVSGEGATDSTTSATSCEWYRQNANTDTSGLERTPGSTAFPSGGNNNAVYRITPSGVGSAVNVFCNMVDNGGGWTLVLSNPSNSSGLDLTTNSATAPTSTSVQANLAIEDFFTGSSELRLVVDGSQILWVQENGTNYSVHLTTKYLWTSISVASEWNNNGGPSWYYGEAGWNDYGTVVYNYTANGDCTGCFGRSLSLFGNGRSGYYNYGNYYRHERFSLTGIYSSNSNAGTRAVSLWAR